MAGMQKVEQLVCSLCGKYEQGSRYDLARRGWKHLEAHEKGVDMPWWDEGTFETVAAFTLCSECSRKARSQLQEFEHYTRTQGPPWCPDNQGG